MRCAERTSQIETMLREWLDEPAITLICGDWRNGCIMEIQPEAPATLTREKYPEPFSGLRDIVLPGQPHHLHVNLDKLAHVVYAITPCVCYGYRPSFEVRFNDAESNTTAFALAVRQPYVGRRTNRKALGAYFRRMIDHHQRFPQITRFYTEPPQSHDIPKADGWEDILACFLETRGTETPEGVGAQFSNLFYRSNHTEERHHA